LNLRFIKEAINKKQIAKLERVSHTFGQANWTMDDYHHRFKLGNSSIDSWKDLDSSLVSVKEVECVFGKIR